MRSLTERFQRMYDRERADYMKRYDFTEEETSVVNLSNPLFKTTKSHRIWRLITLAFCLGHLYGIRYCDEMINTKIVLHGTEGTKNEGD